MYNISAPSYISPPAGTSEKSEMLNIIWLNVGGALHFITFAKSKMYCMEVKCMDSGLTFLHQKEDFLLPANMFNFFANVIKCIGLSIFNYINCIPVTMNYYLSEK